MDIEQQPQDTLRDPDERTHASVIHAQLQLAEDSMREWQDWCRIIDDRYSLGGHLNGYLDDGLTDQRYDLFWASMEVIKPAIYTRSPQPVAAPKFSNKTKLLTTASEMIERCIATSFDLGGLHDSMIESRDDLAMTGRGVIWVRRDGDRLCYDHIDRTDFRHEPARKWADVGWVARRGWMTKQEIKDRFKDISADVLDSIFVKVRRDDRNNHASDDSMVAGIWEVWHKADERVRWVAEGCDTILEDDEPHHKLQGFFPCPRPAYGSLKRRSLVPVPDYFRYAPLLDQVNDLTRRVYNLLAWVKMIGLIPGGGDSADAVQAALQEHRDDALVIPVPGAALSQGGQFVQWMPITEIAASIQGLLEARNQIIQDFYQLSGISDIMRGATEAQETLGAQQLKSQYGSVRVREKINELQRLARDAAMIGGEIIAEEFSKDDIQEMSMIDLPTDAEVKKSIKDAEKGAENDMKALREKIEQQQMPPDEAQKAFQQGQQGIVEKYGPILQEAEAAVTIEQVMALLRKDRIRGFSIDIETDSTVLTDEMTEKQQRAEFLGAFNQAGQSIMAMTAAGEAGAKLAGGVLKFALAPYRVGRDLDAMIDEFIEQAPAALAAQQGEEPDDGLAAAQMQLAQAEMAKVQSQTEANQANAQLKMQELQLKGAEAQAKSQQEQQKFQLELAKTRGDVEETQAQIAKIMAETQLVMSKVGIDGERLQLDAAKAVADQQDRQIDRDVSVRMQQEQAERDQQNQPQQGSKQ